MAFRVVIKKIDLSVDPDKILDMMKHIDIPIGDNMKYYEQRSINTKNNTYTLRIKYRSFNEQNDKMCKFYNDLITYKWIRLHYNENTSFKISMKTIDYCNYIYNNVYNF